MIKLVKILFLSFIFSTLLFNTNIKVEAKEIEKGQSNKKVVYLTFDDGPSKNTEKIMTILNSYKVKGTFFVVGYNMNRNTEQILKQLVENNHYIGMHTMTHNYDVLYRDPNGNQNFINEIVEQQKLILNITGLESKLIRPPYSDGRVFTNQYIEEIINLNMKQWDWNVDTQDWKAKTTGEVIDSVKFSLKLLKNKNQLVVLFHELDLTVTSLPAVIEFFMYNGYEFGSYDPNHHFPLNFHNNPNI